jgi:hypothetical protein
MVQIVIDKLSRGHHLMRSGYHLKKMKSSFVLMLKIPTIIGFLFIATLSIASDHSNDAFAQSIELEAPPLLWEEAPKKQKYDDKDYWKRKYGLRKKGTKELEDAEDNTQLENTKEITTTPSETINNDNTNNDEDNTTQDDKKTSSVVVDEVMPECKYDWALGQKVEDIEFEKFGERPVRVVYRGQSLTKDVNFERINLKISADGTVSKVACF